jgi:hypothetical protein
MKWKESKFFALTPSNTFMQRANSSKVQRLMHKAGGLIFIERASFSGWVKI